MRSPCNIRSATVGYAALIARAISASAGRGRSLTASAKVIIGSDCPSLTPEVLAAAFESLKTSPVVFGSATDGGYYLVGLTRLMPEVFQGIAWGTETVLAQSLKILARLGNKPAWLQSLDDRDRPEDVASRKSKEAAASEAPPKGWAATLRSTKLPLDLHGALHRKRGGSIRV